MLPVRESTDDVVIVLKDNLQSDLVDGAKSSGVDIDIVGLGIDYLREILLIAESCLVVYPIEVLKLPGVEMQMLFEVCY